MIVNKVEEIPLFEKREIFDDTGKKVNHNFVVRNIETEEHVGIISDQYVLVQPRDFVKSFVDAMQADVKRIDVYKGFVKADMTKDEVRLTLFNSVDKTSGVWVVPYAEVEGIRVYGLKSIRQMHRGNVNEVIQHIAGDFEKVQGNFSLFLQGLYAEITEEAKKEMTAKMEKKFKITDTEEIVLKDAKTYFDIYKLLYERVGKRKSNDVRKFMRLVSFIEKILWEGMSSKILSR
jgi:hypothetical protein